MPSHDQALIEDERIEILNLETKARYDRMVEMQATYVDRCFNE